MNLKNLTLTSLFVLSTALSVQAQDHIGWGNDPFDPTPNPSPIGHERPDVPPAPPSHGNDGRGQDGQWDWDHGDNGGWNTNDRAHSIELSINQSTEGNQRLNLLTHSYILQQLRGKRIQSLSVVASTKLGQGRLALLANGQATALPLTVSRNLSSYPLTISRNADTLGENLRTLELQLNGNFYIQSVTFTVLEGTSRPQPRPEQPRVEVLRQQLNETIRDEGGLQLLRLFNLEGERRGQVLRRVTVIASALRGSADVQLQVNGAAIRSERIGFSRSRIDLDLYNNQRIGQEIQRLQLHFRGDVLVEEVSLELENDRGNPRPLPPMERRIEQVVGQRIYGANDVSLLNLMRIDRRHEDRIVDSVDIILRGSDYGSIVKLCQQTNSSLNCGVPQTIFPGTPSFRLTSASFAKLKEISLSVRMGMIDIDRIAVNFR